MASERQRYRWSLVLVLLISVIAQSHVAQSQTEAKLKATVPADIDAWVERSMKTFEVPGIQLAVVKDGQVVFAKGYGVRKLGDPAPVDQNTLFGIASNTKAFTAASVALLVDQRKLSWDDKVIRYLPEFRIADPYVTNELTIRDLLSHRTGLGLGQGDLMFWPDTNFTKEQVLSSARYLHPTIAYAANTPIPT